MFPGGRLTGAASHSGTGSTLSPVDISLPFAPGHITLEFASAEGGPPFFLQPGRGRGKTVLDFRRQNGQGLQVGGRDVGPGLSFSRNACRHILPVIVWPQHIGTAWGGFGLRYAESPQERFGFTRSSLGLRNFAFLTNSQRMLVPLIQGLY